MKIVIVGGGIIGVTTAYFLAKSGHTDIVVLEKSEELACRTGTGASFANGGQISVSHAEPWANPAAPAKILKWLGQEDAPLLWKWRSDLRQMAWGIDFLYQCTQSRWRSNIKNIVNLATYSRSLLSNVREEAGIDNNQLLNGIIHFYTDENEYKNAEQASMILQDFGCHRIPLTAKRLIQLEPALSTVDGLVGGTYTPEDQSGDAHAFTLQLADVCQSQYDITFLTGANVHSVANHNGKVTGVRWNDTVTMDQHFTKADIVIMCAGHASPGLTREHGIHLSIIPVKGYSATVPIIDPVVAPYISLTDDGHKIVFSRLGNQLRIAGTAEVAGIDTTLSDVRCKALTNRGRSLFGEDGFAWESAKYWTGFRPCTPSNVPYIGSTKLPGLYLNTGHGTLGWTMACGSAATITDIVNNVTPSIDFDFYC